MQAKEITLLLMLSLQRALLDQVHDCYKKVFSCKKNVTGDQVGSDFVLIHY
jgi:hypothetical protein